MRRQLGDWASLAVLCLAATFAFLGLLLTAFVVAVTVDSWLAVAAVGMVLGMLYLGLVVAARDGL